MLKYIHKKPNKVSAIKGSSYVRNSDASAFANKVRGFYDYLYSMSVDDLLAFDAAYVLEQRADGTDFQAMSDEDIWMFANELEQRDGSLFNNYVLDLVDDYADGDM